ncbi:MAG: hypothetical protein WC670_18350 [Pseudolabrys sp.]|jgi:hypothetical protein
MTFTVRIFGYRGNTQMRDVLPKQYSADSVRMLEEPYEWGQALVSNGLTAVTSVSNTAQDRVSMLKVEVPDGESIRYEVVPPGGTRSVGVNSPRMSGTDFYPFFPGWTFQFIDHASAP